MIRRLLSLAVYLYPLAWRDRYGDEFNATLEDMPAPRWAAVWNVIQGALTMQAKSNGAIVTRMMTVWGIAGTVLAGLGSLPFETCTCRARR
ncbi:MAG: hypothetical protein FJW31_24520 [Acidobacteria bacterium]|nr:hypothetical protein [Acidobacteriota bacterium]